MSEISQGGTYAASIPRERLFKDRRLNGRSESSNNFGAVVQALAESQGFKPPAWLAEKLKCTERGARMLIDGDRKVTAHAVAVIVNEIVRPR